MVWEYVSSQGKKLAAFNYWPRPTNWVKNISVLVCNQDTFIMQIELAFNLAAAFFWANILPSPRELERKFFTGGYRCGFYLDIPLKGPVEILWGKGTQKMVAEIARPFVTPLFYFWGISTTIEALSSFGTLIYPQYQCIEEIGDGLRKMDVAAMNINHTEGVPGLGEFVFDHNDFLSLTVAQVNIPPGYWRVIACWAIANDEDQLDNLSVGIIINGGEKLMNAVELNTVAPIIWSQTDVSGHTEGAISVSAYFESDRHASLPLMLITCTYFVYYWSPIPFVPGPGGLVQPGGDSPGRHYPSCDEVLDLLT